VGGGDRFDAVVLAGGAASRAGGIDKPGQRVGGRTLLASVAGAAVAAGAARVIVAGPARPGLAGDVPLPAGALVFVREDPPGSGPVPALRAALAQVRSPVVAALAADLPFLTARALGPLLAAVSGGQAAGAVLVDGEGRQQWLAGCWRAGALRAALAAYRGTSLRGLLGPLRPALLACPPRPGEPPPWLDCDTMADLARARRLARHPGEPGEGTVGR
jgi:molybdopterin-guanine dinucleotide biosynthesis protein A